MRLHKSMTNRMLFGVCGGLGETFGIDPNILRVLFVVLHLLTRLPLFLLYLLFAFILPYGGAETRRDREEKKSSFSQTSRTGYTPEAPPFDVSEAKDVDVDRQ